MYRNLSEKMDSFTDCGCPLPYVLKKHNPILGRYVEIRLCCLALALEALIPGVQSFYTVLDESPQQEWDASREPPQFLIDRMIEKDVTWSVKENSNDSIDSAGSGEPVSPTEELSGSGSSAEADAG